MLWNHAGEDTEVPVRFPSDLDIPVIPGLALSIVTPCQNDWSWSGGGYVLRSSFCTAPPSFPLDVFTEYLANGVVQHKHMRMYSSLSALRAENVETSQDHGKRVTFFSDLEVESVVFSLQHYARGFSMVELLPCAQAQSRCKVARKIVTSS